MKDSFPNCFFSKFLTKTVEWKPEIFQLATYFQQFIFTIQIKIFYLEQMKIISNKLDLLYPGVYWGEQMKIISNKLDLLYPGVYFFQNLFSRPILVGPWAPYANASSPGHPTGRPRTSEWSVNRFKWLSMTIF